MKFRDPKTGEVFEDIEKVRVMYCAFVDHCVDCKICHENRNCIDFCDDHPAEAARQMGYEVIGCDVCAYAGRPSYKSPCSECHDYNKFEEVNMEQKDKPRLAEVLGVEVGERFTMRDGNIELPGLYVEKDGTMYERDGTCTSGGVYSFLINHPESIIRAPRLTEAELAICKAVGAKWATKSKQYTLDAVHLWSQKPKKLDDGDFSGDGIWLGCANGALMRSVRPGDCICVEEAQHDA